MLNSYNKNMSIEKFIKERDNSFSSLIYILTSSDDFFFREAIRIIREALNNDGKDFNLDIYDLGDNEHSTSITEIIDNLNMVSIFSQKKYVVIKNFQKIKKNHLQQFSRYLKAPSPYSTLFLLHNGDIKKERTIFFKDLKKIKLDLNTREIPIWISKQAFKKGISISNEAIGFLSDVFSENISILYNEIEKLSLSGKKSIGIKDIDEIIYGTKSLSPFQITKVLMNTDKMKDIKIYNSVKENTDAFMLLGAINWQLSQLMKKKGMDSSHALKSFEFLSNIDMMLKSTNPDFPLEFLILRLFQILKQN